MKAKNAVENNRGTIPFAMFSHPHVVIGTGTHEMRRVLQ